MLNFNHVTQNLDKCISNCWRKDVKDQVYNGDEDDLLNGNHDSQILFTNRIIWYVHSLIQWC